VKTSASNSPLVPPGSHCYGNPAAPYTLVEFGDYVCPSCQAAQPVVERILTERRDSLSYVFHFLSIEEDAGDAPLAPRAAEAADLQGKFWEMHTRLFAEEAALAADGHELTTARVQALAENIGLDGKTFRRDLTSPATRRAVKRDQDLADAFEVEMAPTFFVIEPTGKTTRLIGIDALQHWLATSLLIRT